MRERRAIRVRGIVQGVGFRPFVYALAGRLGLGGLVLNEAGVVRIEAEGDGPDLEEFLAELSASPPPLARIDDISWEPQPPRGETHFRIISSEAGAGADVFIAPDVATCADCVRELFDPADRRFGYPFLNCTNCGPRLTVVTGVPYDRARTTMAAFPLCAACQAEYDDPTNRRFHAQPTACPRCGPALQLLDAQGQPNIGEEPIRFLADALRQGRIAAVKGLGGYHLACDAGSASAVAELRHRKHRDEKPLAIMVADLAAAARLCELAEGERALLTAPGRPIVLLRRRPGTGVAAGVAPGNPYLGVMLPYTPLHHLLFRALGDTPLVMTSGNRSDEPIAYEDVDAVTRLSGIADLFVAHDRPIHVRCDDSVTRWLGGRELPLRRSRGYAPQPVSLPFGCPQPMLAVGGQLKGTFALGRGEHAFLSHHLGDLDHFEAYQAFERDIELYERLFSLRPALLVHDLHPDYRSTHYALKRAAQEGVRVLAVQHHHAHVASCLADNGLAEPVIGVAFDGTGYGTDGDIWGGEFFVGDCRQFRRAAHLRTVGLPGGDAAIREPWRMAAAHLFDARGHADHLAGRCAASALQTVGKMLERRFNSPPTSSAGRLFDAVASLAGVRDCVTFESQAAVELEWLATDQAEAGAYPFELTEPTDAQAPLVIDTRPLIGAVVRDADQRLGAARIARRFHTTLVEIIVAVCGRLRDNTGLDAVGLSGGVFLNALLTLETEARLTAAGFRVFRHRQVPPNDGGLSLGQLAIAAAQL